jgi:hypothetical protein
MFKLILEWFMLRLYVYKIYPFTFEPAERTSLERRDRRDDTRDSSRKRHRSESKSESPPRKSSNRDKEREHVLDRDRERHRDKDRTHDSESERGREGIGSEIVKRVEVKRGMTMTGIEAEKETGIGGDEQNELFLGLVFEN